MRIAQVSPLYESVPPKYYGGTERIVSYLTDTLVGMGHEVVLYASGDSASFAELRAPCERALRLDPFCKEPVAHHVLMIEMVMQQAHAFDLIHFHTEYVHFPMARRMAAPTLTTCHGRLDLADYKRLFNEFVELPLTSISHQQRAPQPEANWVGCVHHGLPADLFRFVERPEPYLAFVGRLSPEKRVERAVEIARRSGMKLKVAAKIEAMDQEYAAQVLGTCLKEPHVEFVGEIGDCQKNEFIGQARALLFPIDWPEPFGLVMIEAMAMGTPVIAWKRGAVSEVVTHGVSGFVVDSIEEAVDAVDRLDSIDRAVCRREFDTRFTADRMAHDYLRIYERILAQRGDLSRSVSRPPLAEILL